MAQKPTKAVSSSSEHLGWSYSERSMGGRKIIAGGGLFVFNHQKIMINKPKPIQIQYQFEEISPEETQRRINDVFDFIFDKVIEEEKKKLSQGKYDHPKRVQ